MIRFVDVPIRVMLPPRIAMKLSPMNILEPDKPVVRARSRTTGIIIATMGVLFKTALPRAMGGKILSCAEVKEPGRPMSRWDRRDIAPVAYMPAATGNNAATVITPVLLNPARSASAGANFKVMAVVKVPMKTSQAGNRSQTRNANIMMRIPSITHASVDITAPSDCNLKSYSLSRLAFKGKNFALFL